MSSDSGRPPNPTPDMLRGLSPETLAALDKEAAAKGVTRLDVIREWLARSGPAKDRKPEGGPPLKPPN